MSLTMKILLNSFTVIWGLAMIPGCFLAFMSPMMFDAPGSEKNPAIVTSFWCVVTFPFICAIAIAGAWACAKYDRSVAAYCLLGLPLVNIAVCYIVMSWK